MMTVMFGIFLLTLLVITAIAIVRTDNLFVAVMLMGIASPSFLRSSVMYAIPNF